MEPMALSLNQRQYVEAVIAALPHLAEAVAAIPPDCQVKAFEAAERSYLRTFRQLGLPGPETWASSVMRRLRRRVREAGLTEQDKLKKLYEQLSADERNGQAYGFDTHDTASSADQKNVGSECEFDKLKLHEQLTADEQVEQAHSFGTHDTASSADQKNVGREGEFDKLKLHEQLSTDEQIGQAPSFDIHETAPSGDQMQLSADECLEIAPWQAHSFARHEAGSSGDQKDVGREGEFDKLRSHEQPSADECLETVQRQALGTHDAASLGEVKNHGREGAFDRLEFYEQLSADEQIGQARDIRDPAPSREQKNVEGEGVKKAAVALRMAEFLIRVDEIFGDARRAVAEKVSPH